MELQSVKQRFGIIGNSAGLNNALSVAMRVALLTHVGGPPVQILVDSRVATTGTGEVGARAAPSPIGVGAG